MIKNGESAPGFSLMDQNGINRSLHDYTGKPVVLLFFRGDFCPTTRKSLPAWQDFTRSLDDLGVAVLAISSTSVERHQKLGEKLLLTYPLLSDQNLEVSKQYGIYMNRAESVGDFGEPGLAIVDSDGAVAYSVISSGPKGLPEPGAVASILIYMSARGGKY